MRLTKLEKRKRAVDRTFASTLKGLEDAPRPWASIRKLRSSASRLVFDKAVAWCSSKNPRKRARAADIVSQFRPRWRKSAAFPPPQMFADEAFGLIAHLLRTDREEAVLRSALFGAGHLGLPEAIPLVSPFTASSSGELRHAATHALMHFTEHPEALQLLTDLCHDVDHDVRNWALFAVGTQSSVDTAELRQTLVRHLNDPFPDAREEAIAGLAQRGDPRAVKPLIRLLASGSYAGHHESAYRILAGMSDETEPADPGALLAALRVCFGAL